MIRTSFLYLSFIVSISTADQMKTVLCIKETYTWSQSPISINATTFVDFIINSNIFIDKSLLIKEVLQDPHKLLSITRPPRWGKSINLDMIRTFLQMSIPTQEYTTYPNTTQPSNRIVVGEFVSPANETLQLPSHRNFTSNYRLFVQGKVTSSNGKFAKLKSPLLISQHQDIVDQYLGTRAVIYLDLSNMQSITLSTLMDEFKTRISAAYKQHNYLISIFNMISNQDGDIYAKIAAQKRLEIFIDVVSNQHRLNAGEVDDALKVLAEMLHVYVKIPIFILIDDYDGPLQAVFSSLQFTDEQKQEFYDYYSDFIRITLQTNTYYEKAIVSGVHPFAEEHYKWVSNIVSEHTFYNGHLMEFYGLERNETNSICQYLNLPAEKLGTANAFFGRPRYQFTNNTIIVNNPWSVAAFLATNKKKDWIKVKTLENFISFFMQIDHKRFQVHFKKLFTDFGEQVKLQYFEGQRLTLDELDMLYKALLFCNETERFKSKVTQFGLDKFTHKALTFLHTNGFLTLYKSPSKLTAEGFTRVKFPIRERFLDMLEVIRYSMGIVVQGMLRTMTMPNL